MSINTKGTKVRRIAETKTASVAASVTASDITTLRAVIKMTDESKQEELLKNLSVDQINSMVDYCSDLASKIEAEKKKIKELEANMDGLDKILLQTLKLHSQKNVVTPEGCVAEVTAGRATSEFTVSVHEFIDIVKEAGHSDVIDNILRISKTEAEKYLGKSLVNKITETKKEEWGAVKFSRLSSK